MCLKFLKTTYSRWFNSYQFHPIWITMADKEVQNKFDVWLYKVLTRAYDFASIGSVFVLCIFMGLNFNKTFAELALFLAQYGTLTFSFVLISLAYRVKLSMIRYNMLVIMGVRSLVSIIVLHLIESGNEHFALIDLKQMTDSIVIVLPALCSTFCNWKFDLLISSPIILIFNVIVTKRSLSSEDGNMACYLQPEQEGSRMSLRWT